MCPSKCPKVKIKEVMHVRVKFQLVSNHSMEANASQYLTQQLVIKGVFEGSWLLFRRVGMIS